MANERPPGGLEIGNVLREARQRAGLEISGVEQQTKIRARYLRALENEQWDVLPGHAYTKGFLRAYAQVLGLDAEALVDEYRRRVEEPPPSHYPLGEPVLHARRGPGEPREPRPFPGRGVVIAALAVALLAVLLVLGLTAGGEDERDAQGERERGGQAQRQEEEKQGEEAEQQPPGLPLRLVANSEITVCLLNGEGETLLDKSLDAGDEERFGSQRYELRFPGGFDAGQLEVIVEGEVQELTDTLGPVLYRIEPGGVSEPETLTATGCP